MLHSEPDNRVVLLSEKYHKVDFARKEERKGKEQVWKNIESNSSFDEAEISSRNLQVNGVIKLKHCFLLISE